jgi:1-acyl-sn-glycerol-3-phosphate acyltransferase
MYFIAPYLSTGAKNTISTMSSLFDKFSSVSGFPFRDLLGKAMSGKISREEFAFSLVPYFTLEVVRRYLRIESEGTENIPHKGRGIVISNHSGYAGFDAVMLQNEIRLHAKREAKLVAHKLWFFGKPVRVVSEKMGLIEADMNSCLQNLNKDEMMILFPEGEAGNFKPSNRRYRLQEFKRGFVRLAMITRSPIIPAFVVGAEETHINLSQIRFTKYLIGTVIPLPLNVLPLPVKWKIKFLPPIHLDNYTAADAMDRKKVLEITKEVRHLLQRAIIQELRLRRSLDLEKIGFTEDDEPGM